MMSGRIEEIRRFRAKTDSGVIYVIVEYQHYIDSATFNNPHGEIEGQREYTTEDGLHVSPVENDPSLFEIIEIEEVVRKL